jgi:hypothetical protein
MEGESVLWHGARAWSGLCLYISWLPQVKVVLFTTDGMNLCTGLPRHGTR